MMTHDPLVRRPSDTGWFLAQVLFGIVGRIGLISLGVLDIVSDRRRRLAAGVETGPARSASGVLVGFGLVSRFVAYVQRRGPGTICGSAACS